MHVKNQVTVVSSNPGDATQFKCGLLDANVPPYPGQVFVSLENNFMHLLVRITKELHKPRMLFDCVLLCVQWLCICIVRLQKESAKLEHNRDCQVPPTLIARDNDHTKPLRWTETPKPVAAGFTSTQPCNLPSRARRISGRQYALPVD